MAETALPPTGSDAARYLIHTPPMRLVDTVLSADTDALTLTATLTLRQDAPYWDAATDRFKAPWSIELIAQATSILFNTMMANDRPQMGFLLAIGDFRCYPQPLRIGDQLKVTSTNKLQLEKFYVQRGEVFYNDRLMAEGDIKCLSDTSAFTDAPSAASDTARETP